MTEIDRTLIGSETEPFQVDVEKGWIRRFADALGDDNPLYREESYAREQGYEGIIAPPTFPVAFRPPQEPHWTATLDRRRILAGEQSFFYERPIVAGTRIECRILFSGVEEKVGGTGKMELLSQETRGIGEDGLLIFVHRRTTVYRTAGVVANRPS